MSELPDGWAAAKVNVVCEKLRGVSYDKSEASREEKDSYVPILRANNIENDQLTFEDLVFVPNARVSEKQKLQPNDVVVAMSSGSKSVVGKTAQLLEDWNGSFGAFCGVLRPSPQIDGKYFGHFFRTKDYRTKVSELSAGTNINNLKNEHFEEIDFPVPPLNEQRRIVAKLEKLLSRVDAAQARLATIPRILKRFRQSVLAAAYSGRLTGDWRSYQAVLDTASLLIENIKKARQQSFKEACNRAETQGYQKPRDYDNYSPSVRTDLELFDIPDEWEWVDLRFLMNEREPFCYGVVQPGLDDKNGVFLVRAGDLQNGSVDLTELRKIPVEIDKEYSRSRLKGGELLITVVGANIGTVSVAPYECKGFNIARAVAKIPIRDFSTRYVFYWLNTSKALSWMKDDAREVARPTLNLEQLKTILVPLPPLAEQQEIVRRVEALFKTADALEARYRTAKAHVDKLTQSILARAFRGELVTTEAELARQEGRDYEPASVLLERIRQERAQQATSTKPKPKQRRAARKAASSTKLFT